MYIPSADKDISRPPAGLYYKTGKFSPAEDAILKSTIENYRRQHNLNDEEISSLIFTKKKTQASAEFWPYIARSIVDRPLQSVYAHVKRLMETNPTVGKSFTREEDARLVDAVKQYGTKWSDISKIIGRPPGACRDRYRNHLVDGEKKEGTWSIEEEEKLKRIIEEFKESAAKKHGASASKRTQTPGAGDDDIYWAAVAKKFGGTRSRAQIIAKWHDNMARKLVNPGGKVARWSTRDKFILIPK